MNSVTLTVNFSELVGVNSHFWQNKYVKIAYKMSDKAIYFNERVFLNYYKTELMALIKAANWFVGTRLFFIHLDIMKMYYTLTKLCTRFTIS